MPSERVERRLSAILAADVAGYSRLMGADEIGTLQGLKGHRRELFEPAIADHNGRVVKTSGDGLLAEFHSVVDAVTCAVACQHAMAARNAAIAEDRRIVFRIGVNLGDIIFDGDDIFGDGVNIAARLEAMCEPGGVCISAAAWDQVRDKLEFTFLDLGEHAFKNIVRPVRIFALGAGAIAALERSGEAAAAPAVRTGVPALGGTQSALALPDKPSIAVLPFQNMSGDPDQEYFADAVTEDIVTALSRWRWFFVIARNSSFIYKNRPVDVRQVGRVLGVRYVLEGSVRRFGSRARVTGQLIDASNAAHLWADNFDRELVDIFSLQDEITEHVVSAIEPAMLHSEGTRVARKQLEDLSAFDCFQRGMWHFNKLSEDDYREAVSLFRETISRDPELALGHIGLARTLYGGVIYGWTSQPGQDLEEAHEAALRAIGLDVRDAYGHFALSGASLYLNRHEEALDEAGITIALNPNFAFGHFRLGQVLIYSGRAVEAVAPIERSMRHSPYDPQLGAMLATLALAHYHCGNYEEAARQSKAASHLPNARAAPVLAASLARLGRLEEAREVLAASRPEMAQRASRARRSAPYANQAIREDLREGLRLAGYGGTPSTTSL